jgi:antistasin family protein
MTRKTEAVTPDVGRLQSGTSRALYEGLVRAPLPFARLICRLACLGLVAVGAPAGCVGSIDATVGADDNNPQGAPGSPFCSEDVDCVLAGPTCCGCPTFAVTKSDPVARACSNVECPLSECAESVIARCNEDQRCELACAPRACDPAGAPCAYGFAADTNGCLTCECAVPAAGGCSTSTDCTRTRADCCGCLQGGRDTAVLAAARAGYDAALACPSMPLCPGINTCTTDEPTCVQGRCELLSPTLPVGACGRSDLPPCPAGTQCIVNVSDQANMHGVGVCGTLP